MQAMSPRVSGRGSTFQSSISRSHRSNICASQCWLGEGFTDEVESSMASSVHSDQQAHIFVVGASRVGKTTLVYGLAAQALPAGQGLAIVDPHGDMAARRRSARGRTMQ